MSATTPEPFVGMGCTINLYSDKMAAVVTKVNAKSIVVARVATDEAGAWRVNSESEPYPVIARAGILTEIIGEPERYARVETSYGVCFRNGSVGVTLGKSISLTDYRY